MKKIIAISVALLAVAALLWGKSLIRSACLDHYVDGWRGGYAAAEDRENPERVYPTCGVVIEVNQDNDTVTVEDVVGFTWTFYGAEDWCPGDIAAFIMYDYGTVSVLDDEIVDLSYCGTVDMFEDIASSIARH